MTSSNYIFSKSKINAKLRNTFNTCFENTGSIEAQSQTAYNVWKLWRRLHKFIW